MAVWVIGDRRRCIASLTSAPLDRWTVQVPPQQRYDRLLQRVQDSRGGFHRLLFVHGAEDIVDYPVLDGEDIAIAHYPRRVR